MWSSRSRKYKERPDDETFVVSGRAYPEVLAGKNPTDIVTSNVTNREQFYRDPAIKLSDENLDECNGAEGLPLCVEHNINDVRGSIFHSFIGDDEKRGLKIIAHIPIKRNGQYIPAGIQARDDIINKKYRGFSVGYGNELVTASRGGRTTRVSAKVFREISLVKEPFFENCTLSYSGVEASKKGFNNSDYNLNLGENTFFIEIQMSESVTGPTPGAAAPAPTATTTGPAGATPQQESIPGHELLLETNNMKHALNNELKARQEMEERTKALEKKNQDYEAKLKYFEEKERQEAEAYAKQQEPKAERYIQALTASKAGAMLTEADKQGFRRAFMDIKMRKNAEFYDKQYEEMVELQAAKEKEATEKKALLEEVEKLKNANAMGAKLINNARTNFVNALETPTTTTEAAVAASKGLELNGMMEVPIPSLAELPFLRQGGYRASSDVNASQYGASKPMVTHVPIYATNRLHEDENGELNFPNSARNIPGCDVIFHWMCDNPHLRSGDLGSLVNIVPKYNTQKRLDGAEWEERHQIGSTMGDQMIGTSN